QPIPRANYIGVEDITRIHARATAALFVSLHPSAGKRSIHLIVALIESGGLIRRRGWLIHQLFRIIAVDNKIDCNTDVHNSKQQAADRTGETALKPIARISVTDANSQHSIVV